MSDIRIDDDGFLVGDNDPANPSPDTQNTAENALLKAVQEGNRAIVSILRETQGLQRDTLKATQEAKKRTRTVRATPPIVPPSPAPRVNLVHPNRPPIVPVVPAPRVNLVHPNRPQPTPPIAPPVVDTARLNPDRANEAPNAPNSEPSQDANNNKNAAERSATSRITDSLKDLSNTLTVNANTDRIDPMVDAIKEAGSVITVGIDAGKKVLSVGNTLIAKPAMALGRGIKGLIKPKTDAINSPTAWYKRIWRTLVQGNRQDQTQHNQEQRRLDEIARGQGSGGGSDNSSLLMVLGLGLAGLLAAIKNIKIPSLDELKKKFKELGTDNESPIPISRIPKLPTPALPPTRFQSWMTKLGETKVGKALGTFAKKIPFITSALEAGAGGINAVNIDNDKNLTDTEKERAQSANAGKTVGAIGGGLGGATAGMAAGAAIGSAFPIIGTAIGTVVGGLVGSWLGTTGGRIVGEKVGGWVDDLANADIAGRMGNAWDAFLTPLTPMFAEIKNWTVSTWQKTQDAALGMWESVTIDAKATWSTITSSWDGLIANVSSGFESIATTATEFNDWFKKKTGIDIGKGLTGAKDAVVDTVSRNVVPVVVGMGESLAINAKANTEKLKENAASFGQGIKDAPLVQALGKLGEGLSGAAFALTQPTDKEKTSKSTQANYNKNSAIINDAAKRNGLTPQFMAGVAYTESSFKGGSTKANSSTATGLYQFVDDTWADQVARSNAPEAQPYKAQAQAYLADKNKGVPRSKRKETYKALLSARSNDQLNAVIGGQYLRQGLDALKKSGVSNPSMAEVYAYHHDGNAKRVIDARHGDKSALAQLEQWGTKLNTGAAYAKNTQAPTVTPKAIATPTANMATNSVPSMKAAPVNAVPVPNVQSIQSVQAKEQPTRLNSTPTPIKVSFAKPLVGQNVSDREIAHILTGGIGETV